MKKKILLINQGDTENYGDIAINDTIKTFFEKKGYIVDFLSYWNEKKIFGNLYNYKLGKNIFYRIINKVPFFTDFFYINFLKKNIHKKYDCVIIGGGELLSSHRGFNNALYNITSYFYSKCPIYVIGVSGNSNLNKTLTKRYNIALKRCDKVFVRDGFTYDICKNIYKLNAELWPDVVFSYKIVKEIKNNTKMKKNIVLFAPIEYYDEIGRYLKINTEDEFIEYLIKKILTNLDKNDTLIIAPTVSTDNIISEKIFRKLKERCSNKLEYSKYSDIDSFIDLLKSSKKIISCRMHGLILGKIFGCEINTIVFKNKLKVFKKEYQDSNYIINNVEKKSFKSLEQILN